MANAQYLGSRFARRAFRMASLTNTEAFSRSVTVDCGMLKTPTAYLSYKQANRHISWKRQRPGRLPNSGFRQIGGNIFGDRWQSYAARFNVALILPVGQPNVMHAECLRTAAMARFPLRPLMAVSSHQPQTYLKKNQPPVLDMKRTIFGVAMAAVKSWPWALRPMPVAMAAPRGASSWGWARRRGRREMAPSSPRQG